MFPILIDLQNSMTIALATRVRIKNSKKKRAAEKKRDVRIGREAGEDEAVAVVDVEKDAAVLPCDPRI